MSKGFWGIIAILVIIFGGVVALSNNKSSNTNSTKNSSSLSQHIEGSGNVTLVEYGDYECPFCQQYYQTVKTIQTEYNDRVKFQFRNFPLTSLHRNAFAAARAAEAASLQGKFWEMHDALYDPSNYQVWKDASNPNPYFDQYAQQLSLDPAKFKTDFASSKVNDTINADLAEGNRLGITGTPTFFVDGKQVSIANDISQFEKVLNAALAKQTPASAGATSQTKANQ